MRTYDHRHCANCGALFGLSLKAYCLRCERVAKRRNRCVWCAAKLPHADRACMVFDSGVQRDPSGVVWIQPELPL